MKKMFLLICLLTMAHLSLYPKTLAIVNRNMAGACIQPSLVDMIITPGDHFVTLNANMDGGFTNSATFTRMNYLPPSGKTWSGSTSTDWNTASNWSPAGVPISTDDITISGLASNQPVISNTGLQCNNLVVENAASITIDPGYDLTINGDLTLDNGSSMSNEGTVFLLGNLVNQNVASSILDTGTFDFSGLAAQSISGLNIFGNLTINNSNGVNLLDDQEIDGRLKLTAGHLILNGNNLELGSSSIITGSPSTAAMIIATGTGQLRKYFSGTGSFTFPVGDNNGTAEYSPVTLNFTAGSFAVGAFAGVNLVNSKYSGDLNSISYLKRYWVITQSGITGFSCDAIFQYVLADVAGTESDIYGVRVNPTPADTYNLCNTSLHKFAINGLTSFGTFAGTDKHKILNLTIFLEGLYAGSGMMNPAMDISGSHWGSTIADEITIELHDTLTYSTIYYTAGNIFLNTDGTAQLTIPAVYNSKYYITIKHRNSLETVTKTPVSFNGSTINYDYSTSASKAYGNNLKGISGVYVIYSGDVTSSGNGYPAVPVQDGMIDLDDLYYIFDSYINGDYNYVISDLNGDGMVDISDQYLAFDNFILGIYVMTP